MARRTPPKKRKERRPFIPAGTVTEPIEVPAPADRVATAPAGRGRERAKERVAPRFGLPLNTDYSYVARDLRKIMILTGILIAGMVALAFVVPG